MRALLPSRVRIINAAILRPLSVFIRFVYASDGQPILYNDMWESGEPDTFASVESHMDNIVTMYSPTGKWSDFYLEYQIHSFVCEQASGPNLEWQRVDHNELDFFFGFARMNQTSAVEFCEEKGGRLYEPRVEGQLERVLDRAKEYSFESIWIGVSDEDNEGRYVLDICCPLKFYQTTEI